MRRADEFTPEAGDVDDFPSGTGNKYFPPVPEWRHAFAAFIERLVAGPRPPIDWGDFVATHYYDSGLEWLRREISRRSDEFVVAELPETRRAEFLAWADRLRRHAT